METTRGVGCVSIVDITHMALTVSGVNQDTIVLLGYPRLPLMSAKVQTVFTLILVTKNTMVLDSMNSFMVKSSRHIHQE